RRRRCTRGLRATGHTETAAGRLGRPTRGGCAAAGLRRARRLHAAGHAQSATGGLGGTARLGCATGRSRGGSRRRSGRSSCDLLLLLRRGLLLLADRRRDLVLGQAAAHALEQHLGHVEHVDVLALLLLGGHAVGHHHAAERAAGDDLLGAGGQGLVDALHVDALADLLLHPHAGTAGTTAQGALAVTRHLLERGLFADQVARRLVDVVVAAEEAGVVVGDLLLLRAGHGHQTLVTHQPVEQLGVVDDLVVAA